MKIQRNCDKDVLGMTREKAEHLAWKYFDMPFRELDDICAEFFSRDPIGREVSFNLGSHTRTYDNEFMAKYEAELDAWFDIKVMELAKPYREYIQMMAL